MKACCVFSLIEAQFFFENSNGSFYYLGVKVWFSGAVAQLGEHLLCKQGVRSSSLLSSTTIFSYEITNFLLFREESILKFTDIAFLSTFCQL